MKQEKLSIIYNKFCPYAQRALIAAIEKEVPAQFITTGLGETTKTKFFMEAYSKSLGRDPNSPGKVPILIHHERYLAESQIVCWYLAETFQTGTELIPKDTFMRAKMRVWIDQINEELINIFDRAKLNRIEVVEDFLKQIEDFLGRVQSRIEGEYLLGSEISLADVLIYPWFERWVIIEHFFGYPIPQHYEKIKRWLKNMTGRKSIIQTKKLTTNEYYIERTKKMMSAKL